MTVETWRTLKYTHTHILTDLYEKYTQSFSRPDQQQQMGTGRDACVTFVSDGIRVTKDKGHMHNGHLNNKVTEMKAN